MYKGFKSKVTLATPLPGFCAQSVPDFSLFVPDLTLFVTDLTMSVTGVRRFVPDLRRSVTGVTRSVTGVTNLGAELNNIFQKSPYYNKKCSIIMLIWDFIKVFKMRGIRRPYSYLRSIGFSHSLAHRIGTNKIDKLSLDNLEKLCEHLKCTPHDFLVWKPRKAQAEDEHHALRILLPDKSGTRAANLLKKLTLEQIRKLERKVLDDTDGDEEEAP